MQFSKSLICIYYLNSSLTIGENPEVIPFSKTTLVVNSTTSAFEAAFSVNVILWPFIAGILL